MCANTYITNATELTKMVKACLCTIWYKIYKAIYQNDYDNHEYKSDSINRHKCNMAKGAPLTWFFGTQI